MQLTRATSSPSGSETVPPGGSHLSRSIPALPDLLAAGRRALQDTHCESNAGSMQRDISGYVLPMDPRQGPNLSPTLVPTVFGYWVRWATVGCPVDPAVLLDAYSRSATLVEVTPLPLREALMVISYR